MAAAAALLFAAGLYLLAGRSIVLGIALVSVGFFLGTLSVQRLQPDRATVQPDRATVARTAGFAVLAIPVGVVAFFPLFGVLFAGPAEISEWKAGDIAAAGISLAAFLAAGGAFGYINRTRWPLAGILAWPCVLVSLTTLAAAASDPAVRKAVPTALMLLVVPLAVVLAGGYLGRTLVGRPAH